MTGGPAQAPGPVPGDGGDGPSGPAGGQDDPHSALLEVGRIVKPHGLRGDVIVSLSTNRDERVAAGSVLTAADGRELRVVRSSPHQGRFIVTFDGVVGIDGAERLRDLVLYAPPLDDPDALWIHDLIGAQVEDAGGSVLGTVEGVEANPASDLLVLTGGALIPLRFVLSSEPGVRVTVDVPDGLLDLP
ncbi:MAG: ribosome maturation factor RimM [Acidimicrobiales bacterium]